jgi:hypothetical protein
MSLISQRRSVTSAATHYHKNEHLDRVNRRSQAYELRQRFLLVKRDWPNEFQSARLNLNALKIGL